MSRESEKLFDAVGRVDDGLIEDVLDGPVKKKRKWLRWTGPAAAVLTVAVLCGVLFGRGGSGYAIALADYPKDINRKEIDFKEYAPALRDYLTASIPALLSGEAGENQVCSPLNVYVELSMLAEATAGNTRAQILALLGAESIETVRERAGLVWRMSYQDEKQGKCVLANSLWLAKDVPYNKETLGTLADDYYVSSYRGEMGSEGYNNALHSWLNAQTGGLLREQAEGLSLDDNTLLALVSTVYFSGKWAKGFSEQGTAPDVFHSAAGDLQCDFMHRVLQDACYWGERFSAISLRFLDMDGCSMWLILPDEGVTPEALLRDEEALDFLSMDRIARGAWEKQKRVEIRLSVPKFDVCGNQELSAALRALGVTDALDPFAADFSPMTDEGVFVSQARHAARVRIDEEGCEAAAYTVLGAPAEAMPPDEEIDFTLDRPFLFAITGTDGLPLFVGLVNQP